MFDFFRRYRQRQRDLAAGADADRFASNRKKAGRGAYYLGEVSCCR